MGALRAVWAAIQSVLHLIGRVMTVVLLTVVYVVVVVPLGVVLWAARKQPLYAGRIHGTTWHPRESHQSSLDDALHPF